MAGFLMITCVLEQKLMKLNSFDLEEMNLPFRLGGDLAYLKGVLTDVQALLQDVEERRLSDIPAMLQDVEERRLTDIQAAVLKEVEKVRLVMIHYFLDLQGQADLLEIELDRFAKVRLSTIDNSRVREVNYLLRNCLHTLLTLLYRIRDSLESIITLDNFNKREVGLSGLPLTSIDVEIVGRGDDVSKIVKLLMGLINHQLLPVVPIVGMAGLGKTSLAKLVFEAVKERQLFDVTIWVSVSNDFEELPVLGEMLKTLGEHLVGGVNNIDESLELLSKQLEGKKFLLVLDDVWNEDVGKWNRLKDCLLKVSRINGSAILITTCSSRVASVMEAFPGCRHDLKGLSDDECWSIIREKVSGNEGEPMPSDLEAIGKEIASKCGGVPLVALFLGEMMRCRKEREQWLSIKNSCLRDTPRYEDIIMPILKKGFFDNLHSSALKLCFAYCSIFSQDFTVEKEQLIQLWMAEGLLVQSNERMEDTGEIFFNNLVDSSFFEVVEWDGHGNIRGCKMNRLLHDLALYVSKFQTWNLETCSDIDVVHLIRHANVNSDVEVARVYTKIEGIMLRSLFSRADIGLHWSRNFTTLRTLNLDGADIKELIDSIGDLQLLKYLDLSRTCIKALPESITELYNLQTLRLIECTSLQTLPRNMKDLLSLRHIFFTYHHQMPVKVGCLTCLQTLPFFVVGKDRDSTIQELESLNGLRGQLSIYNLQEVRNKKEAEKANLRGKTKIYKLEFVWRSRRKSWKNDEEVLEALQPHSNIESLKIKHYEGEKLPSWLLMENPSHGDSLPVNSLVNLKLIDCKRCELPKLGHLPHLKSLEIDGLHNVRTIDMEFYRSTGFSETIAVFPALKKLSLRRMVNLVEWMVPAVGGEGSTVVFPCLEELSILSCPLLTSFSLSAPLLAQLEICFCDELKYLSMECHACTSLEDLTIKYCPNLESIPSAECLTSLKRLHNEGCDKLISPLMPSSQTFTSLEYLRLEGFPDLLSIPGLQNFSLKGLAIKHCPNLECIASLQHLTALEDLSIEVCSNLESIPSVGGLSSLKRLSIHRCHKLTSLPTGLQSCISLENLSIQWCIELTSIPDKLQELHSLLHLEITKCPSLTSFSEDSLYSLTQLKKLTIGPFSEKLEAFPGLNSIQHLHGSLEELQIYGWNRLKSLPDQLQYLTALKSLSIGRFNKVEALPEWLGNLFSLQQLRIWRCKDLRYLPTSMQRLFILKKLEIIDCHFLMQKCAKGSGPEWSKISHIPKISML